jgi:glycyl-tRNA synthetase beta chain
MPATRLGRLLAVADKLDTLATLFAIGVTPTGSADPFGLRREAYGIVRILDEAGHEVDRAKRVNISISQVLAASLAVLGGHVELDRSADQTIAEVIEFLRDRLALSLREDGIRYDLVDAALAVGVDDISEAWKRARTLSFAEAWDRAVPPPAPFLQTVIACTRPMNIVKGFEGGEVDENLFVEPAERDLWDAYQDVAQEADRVKNLLALFKAIAEKLRVPIDRYFDEVLVMAEDEKIRRNRLALCWQLSQLFRRLADFSLIVQT